MFFILLTQCLLGFAIQNDSAIALAKKPFLAYQKALDSMQELEQLPDFPDSYATSFHGQKLDHRDREVEDAFIAVERSVFGTNGLVNLSFTDDPEENARYILSSHEILISIPFLKKIREGFSLKSRHAIFRYIIAHEISHLIIETHCLQSDEDSGLSSNPCSQSFFDNSKDFTYETRYNYLKTYIAEHIDVEILTFFMLEDLGIEFRPIYEFLKASPIPYGQSKRISDLLQLDRSQRIQIFKSLSQ